ncbi:Lithocholate 6-beta-hydroxylase, partial [Araneus ventricosus]
MLETVTFTWILAGVIVVFAFIKWYLGRNDDYWQKRGVPFAPRISFIGLMFKLAFNDITELLKDMANKPFGKVFGSFEGSLPTVVVAEPDLLRDILVKDFHIFPYRRPMMTGDPVADSMVSLMIGEDWKRVRTIITPAFTSKRMRQMSSIIDECSKSVVEVCEEYCEKGKPVDFKSTFGAFTMDVIAKSAFGTQINSHKDPQNEFVRKVRESFLNFTIPRMMLS